MLSIDGERSVSTSRTILPENVVAKSLEDIHEPIDARLSESPRPNADQLDESLGRQLSNLVRHPHHSSGKQEKESFDTSNEPIYVCSSTSYQVTCNSEQSRSTLKKAILEIQPTLACVRNG